MKLEQQVVSLDLAKQLKEAGYKQEGLFYWWWSPFGCHPSNPLKTLHYNETFDEAGGWYCTVAPTVAELGEVLKHPNQDILSYHPKSLPDWTGSTWIMYRNGKVIIEGNTEANARAKMWLYFKKKGLL